MKLSGLHLLLTYRCERECDHCFVWGSPWQRDVMTVHQLDEILHQAKRLGTLEWVYLEGGEPFLYYAVMLRGVRRAVRAGMRVGVVTNGYWATDLQAAVEWLKPLAGLLDDLSLSCDEFHQRDASPDQTSKTAKIVKAAADKLGMPLDVIRVAPAAPASNAEGACAVIYRGRAVDKLAADAPMQPWESFSSCTREPLRAPERVHVDPLGYVHVCQGIAIGNVFRSPLSEIVAEYDPEAHPIIGPLLAGGPAELARSVGFAPHEGFADGCHLCDEARHAVRDRFPEILVPDAMYGAIDRPRA